VNLGILIGHFPPGPFGGAEIQAERWATRLAKRHQVTVITRRDPPDQTERESRDGFTVMRLPVSSIPLARTALDVEAISRAVAAMSPRPDLLLCFQTFVSGLAGVRIQRRLGIPAVVWIRGEAEYRLRDSFVSRMVSPRVWRDARGVLVQTDGNRTALLAELQRVSPAARRDVEARLEVIPNGVDLPTPVATSGGRVLSIGRLIPEKGMDVVIDAVTGIQGLLTIAGEGPERGQLEARARGHALDCRFEGFVTGPRLEELFQQSACLVLASRKGEGLPNVVLEAFAHAIPVVATDVAGTRDLVQHDVNGLLCPPNDPRALREALARLTHERGLADRLARAGRATAESMSWERVEPLLDEALEKYAGGRVGGSCTGRSAASGGQDARSAAAGVQVPPGGRDQTPSADTSPARAPGATPQHAATKLCIYNGYLYPVLSGEKAIEFAGGAEVQQAMLARGLAARGFDVTAVTCDYGQPSPTYVDGVRVLKTHEPFAGIPVVRFFHPRLSTSVRALWEANADVYHVRGSGLAAGIAHDIARMRGAAFVLGAAHEWDALRTMPFQTNPRDRWWYARAVRGADAIVAQTETQRRNFKEQWGRESELIPNLVEIPAAAVDPGRGRTVVWIATYKPAKRPEWVIELARRMPGTRFLMCGVIPIPPETTAAWDAARAAAAGLPNLEVRGYVARDRLHELFADAALFIHTSPAEGFPNTVLEAWAHGVPSVSVVDPDGVIRRERLGEVAERLEDFERILRARLADPEWRRATGARAREHVRAVHASDAGLERFAALLERVHPPPTLPVRPKS
jgi:glycosyltransferase involved in cell wall biosynthesis